LSVPLTFLNIVGITDEGKKWSLWKETIGFLKERNGFLADEAETPVRKHVDAKEGKEWFLWSVIYFLSRIIWIVS
jgi:hypothetical protein